MTTDDSTAVSKHKLSLKAGCSTGRLKLTS